MSMGTGSELSGFVFKHNGFKNTTEHSIALLVAFFVAIQYAFTDPGTGTLNT